MSLIDQYVKRGWSVIPINRGSKAPAFSWQHVKGGSLRGEITENVGVVLHNSGLVDVDIDCPEALELAQHFLPETAVFGRPGAPRSHWIYSGAAESKRFKCPQGSTLIEIRSSGAQTVFPPSIHPSGEQISWVDQTEPLRAPDALLDLVSTIAAGALLVRYSPSVGSRHDFALALGGALARMGWDSCLISSFVAPVFTASGFADLDTHVKSAAGSVSRYLEGEATTGWATVGKLIGTPGVRLIRSWLGDSGKSQGRESISLSLSREKQVDLAISAVSKLDVFQKAGRLVQIRREPGLSAQLHEVAKPRLDELIDQCVQFVGVDDDGNPKPTGCPAYVSPRIAARGTWGSIRPIDAVVTSPLLCDGKIATKGYVYSARVYCDSGIDSLGVPEDPPRAEALEALALLREPFCDVPFASATDESAAIAFLLSLLARYSFDLCPMFVFDANVERTGKTLLVRSLASVALGFLPGVSVLSPDEEERRKSIFSTALVGAPLSIFDNVKGSIDSPTIEGAITSGMIGDRVLGKSEFVTLPLKTVFAVTANNAILSGDLSKRSIPIRLRSEEESPEKRTGFRYSLPKDVISWRSDLLRAAFTVLLFRGDAEVSAIGSFESWESVVCRPLVSLGWPNPVLGQDLFKDDSDEIASPLSELFDKMSESYPSGAPVSILHSAIEFRPIYSELFGKDRNLSVKTLAQGLRRFRRRIVGGRYLDFEIDPRTKRPRWLVRETTRDTIGPRGGL